MTTDILAEVPPKVLDTPTAKSSQSHAVTPAPRQDEPDLPSLEFSARFVDPAEWPSLEAAWRRLVETALEPNAFHEPWFLLPALRNLSPENAPELLVVEAPKRVFPTGPKVICGIFPIVRRRSFYGVPVRCWELWSHEYSFLGTPLVRRDCAREVLDHFFQYAAGVPRGAAVVHLPTISGDGPLHRILIESNVMARRNVFTRGLGTRAMFRRAMDAETFLKASLSRKKRQGIQRIERRLAESGNLSTTWFGPGDNLPEWTEAFLTLESSGWKGRIGTALGSTSSHAEFFRDMLAGAAAEGKLLLGRLAFNDRPIAMICNLLTADGGYSYKIAYDESFAEHSPGLLLELALIRELHARGVEWVDSCAAADHPMINHLWPSRTIRQSLVVSTGARGGDFATALMPLLRQLKNAVRRTPTIKPIAE